MARRALSPSLTVAVFTWAALVALGLHPLPTAAQLLPRPSLTELRPTTLPVGSELVQMEVRGRDFLPGAVVRVGGTPRATLFSSTTSLLVTLDPADLASTGGRRITALNLGTTESNALTLAVVNPVPAISSLSPAVLSTHMSDAVMIDVHGSRFAADAVVSVDGQARLTEFVSAGRVRFRLISQDRLTAGSRAVTVFNPAPGGGVSGVASMAIENARPGISELDPAVVNTWPDEVLVTVRGRGFSQGSVARVNGQARNTTVVSWSQLRFILPASDKASVGARDVTVFVPAPGGGESSASQLSVENPQPVLSSLDPTSVVAGATDGLTLALRGAAFAPGARVVLGGVERTPQSVQWDRVEVRVPADELATAGALPVFVRNPAPGGGTSLIRTLDVQSPSAGVAELTVDGTGVAHNGTADLGSLPVGADRSVTVQVRNVGTASLSLSRPTFTGPAASDYSINLATATIGSGAAVGTSVRVAPSAAGVRAAELHIPNNSADNPLIVRLTATGTNPVPAIASIDPGILLRPFSGSVQLRLRGSGFTPASLLNMTVRNGQEPAVSETVAPTGVTGDELQANVPASWFERGARLEARVRNPAPGGGESNGAVVEARNPTPRITALEPAALDAGSPATRVRVTGTGFVPAAGIWSASVARWNGADRPTIYRSPTELEVDLSAGDLASAGNGRLTVFNAAPGGGSSPEASLEVPGATAPANPSPVVAEVEIGPAAGVPGWALVVHGSGFVQASVVRWDGRELETTFQSEGELRARVPPGQANPQRGDVFTVTVRNPAPGGGTSQGVQVTVPR